MNRSLPTVCDECHLKIANRCRVDSSYPNEWFCDTCWSNYDNMFNVQHIDVYTLDVSHHERMCVSKLSARLSKAKQNDVSCYSQKAIRKVEGRKHNSA